jgi:hypothetical protein
MVIPTLKAIFLRDLEKLRDEISSYHDENSLWVIDKSIANSGGNLCLHLVGNLNTYFGAEILKTGYVRRRDLEFSLKNVPQKELLEKIEETIAIVETSLDMLTEEDMDKEYPLLVFEEKTTTGYLLIHLVSHLSYHLGQISYHRRMLGD